MLTNKINDWFNKTKQYFFTYKNGFFNLSYLSDTPYIMIKCFGKMPFTTLDEEKNILYSDTPFVKGTVKYKEIEEGLWFMVSETQYKNNVSFRPIYNKTNPSDYYIITLSINKKKQGHDFFDGQDFIIKNYSITFIKPSVDCIHGHFKGASETQYILYLNQAWINNNLKNETITDPSLKELFLNPQKKYLNFSFQNEKLDELIQQIDYSFADEAYLNFFELKKLTYNFLGLFINSIKSNNNDIPLKITPKDYLKLKKIEHEISKNLYGKFIGIEVLSNKFKTSPTKLKKDFKILYGKSIYQYFQYHKMQLAHQYLKEKNINISHLAEKMGYENVSKFSKAFQKQNGILPSKVKQLSIKSVAK